MDGYDENAATANAAAAASSSIAELNGAEDQQHQEQHGNAGDEEGQEGIEVEEEDQEEEQEQEQEEEDNECLLCKVDCRPEAYGITPSATQSLRQLMLIEASNFGMVPDSLLFAKVADAYRRLVYDPATDRGEIVPLWTTADVQHHFTRCITLLPRRNIVTAMRSLGRIEKHIRLKELYQTDQVSGQRELCVKSLDSYLKVQKTRLDMQKTLMAVNKLDAAHVEASKLGVMATTGGGGGAGGAGDALGGIDEMDVTGESMFG